MPFVLRLALVLALAVPLPLRAATAVTDPAPLPLAGDEALFGTVVAPVEAPGMPPAADLPR